MHLITKAMLVAAIAIAPAAAIASPGQIDQEVAFDNDALTFAAFDTSLGTLKQVGFRASANFNFGGTITNITNANLGTSSPVSLTYGFAGGGGSYSNTLTVGGFGGFFEPNVPVPYSATDRSLAGGFTINSNFAYFLLGAPVIDLNYAFTMPNPALSAAMTITALRGTGTLSYFYEPAAVDPSPAPEPATWAMMLIGFGSLGTVLRRRPKALLA